MYCYLKNNAVLDSQKASGGSSGGLGDDDFKWQASAIELTKYLVVFSNCDETFEEMPAINRKASIVYKSFI